MSVSANMKQNLSLKNRKLQGKNTVLSFVVLVNLVLAYLISPASAHGTMIDPVSRNSLWRVDPEAPVNYNDIELFCGGIGVYTSAGGQCGPCGDSIRLPRPRPHETGGSMAMNRTMRNYFPGSSIDVMINLVTNHGGHFEFDLCQRDSFNVMEDESCFKRLKFIDGSDRFRLSNSNSEQGYRAFSLEIPSGLRECRACILRWNYRAGNNWGVCQNGTVGVGCGFQELYRNCADISIGYNNGYGMN